MYVYLFIRALCFAKQVLCGIFVKRIIVDKLSKDIHLNSCENTNLKAFCTCV